MALDYSPYFKSDSKNSYNEIVVVPSNTSSSNNARGVKYKNFTTNFDTITDTYSTAALASERAYNLGCTGYRRVLISSAGNYAYAPCQTNQEYVNIMAQIPKGDMKRRYYLFDPTENIYGVTDSINDNAYVGFDYKREIFQKSLSGVLFRNPRTVEILNEYQKVVFALIETVKQIRNYFNYTVPFNNRRVF